MAVEAYIFDIDDTLLATTRANQRARRRCLESFLKAAGIEPDEHAAELERKLYKVFGWSKLRDIWCALAIELGMERPQTAWLEQAEELFVSTFFENLAALETVAHTLEALRGRGKRLGIISDGDERLQLRKLHETGRPLLRSRACRGDDSERLLRRQALDGQLPAHGKAAGLAAARDALRGRQTLGHSRSQHGGLDFGADAAG
jgi:phosphoglycolate phosphatase-like HAD superfamily hydrolase